MNWLNKIVSSEKYVGYILLLPAVITLFCITIFPLFFSLIISFYRWDLLLPPAERVFIGLQNYVVSLKDPVTWAVFRNTCIFTFWVVLIEMTLGTTIALMINGLGRFKNQVRSLLMLPMVITPVIIGLTWRFMFDYAPINYFVKGLHLSVPYPSWLTNPHWALIGVIIADIWEWTPFVMLIVYTQLISLPKEPLEAALVDGANSWHLIRYVVFPLLKPTFMIIILIRLMDALKIFDLVMMMTLGGPGVSSESIVFNIWRTGFKYTSMGEASAKSFMLLALITFLSIYFARLLESEKK